MTENTEPGVRELNEVGFQRSQGFYGSFGSETEELTRRNPAGSRALLAQKVAHRAWAQEPRYWLVGGREDGRKSGGRCSSE